VRADRLVAALLLMQSKGQITAAELAFELEVSVATARRDLEALSAAGIPVYPQAGRGGGWSLVGGARTDLSGLTAPEARALFLLAGPGATGGSPELRSALRKLVRALPARFRIEAEAAADAVVVDPRGWGERRRATPELVETLQDAVIRRRKVRMDYAGRTKAPSERLVDPWGLVAKDDIWYLVAGTSAGRRTFRVDRMETASVTEETAERPADFDLAWAWDDVVTEVERKRSLVSATVLVEERHVDVLRRQFGRHCEVSWSLTGGPARAKVSAPTALDLARHLAGWGAGIELVEPDSVREELARIAAELSERYPQRRSG
jgi:predicted DNA-binding transcriptional regulator YafY